MPTSRPRKKQRRIRRDYSRKRFANPVNRHKKKPGVLRAARKWIVAAVVILALGGWFWFFGYSDHFRIEKITISGNDRIPAWEIRDAVEEVLNERRWLIVPNRSILLLPEELVVTRLQENFVLESASAVKEPPNALHVEVRERPSTILLQMDDGSQATLDLDGVVIRRYHARDALDITRRYGPERPGEDDIDPVRDLRILYADQAADLELRDRAVTPDVIRAVIDIPDLIADRFDDLTVKEVRMDEIADTTLKIMTGEGWAVYVDASRPLAAQLDAAAAVMREKVGADRPRLDYVDARFGEKIFYKLR